jgi:hypothetical protein
MIIQYNMNNYNLIYKVLINIIIKMLLLINLVKYILIIFILIKGCLLFI